MINWSFLLLCLSCKYEPKKSISSLNTSAKVVNHTPTCFEKSKDSPSLAKYKPLKYFKGDTIAYMDENFVKQKKLFKNKPFACMRSSLEISPLNFIGIDTAVHSISGSITEIDILFSTIKKPTLKKTGKRQMILVVSPQKPISVKMFRANINERLIGRSAKDFSFLDKVIIGDIHLSITQIE